MILYWIAYINTSNPALQTCAASAQPLCMREVTGAFVTTRSESRGVGSMVLPGAARAAYCKLVSIFPDNDWKGTRYDCAIREPSKTRT